MKYVRGIVVVIVAFSVLYTFSLTTALAVPGGILDGEWFKVKVKLQGRECLSGNPYGSKATKATFKTTLYMRFYGDPNSYSCDIWCESTPGNWTLYSGTAMTLYGSNEAIGYYVPMSLSEQGGDVYFTFFVSPEFRIQTKKSGELKRASFKSKTGTVYGTRDNYSTIFYGDGKVTGTRINPSNLPFSP